MNIKKNTGRCSGLILIGGQAKRANGQEKYLFEYLGKPFILHQTEILSQICDEIILVAKDEDQCDHMRRFTSLPCIPDIRRNTGPMGAIHAGAKAVSGDLIFVTACDMPLLSKEIIAHLFSQINSADAVVPIWEDGRLEPLHAVYRQEIINRYLDDNLEKRISSMVKSLRTIYVPVEELKKFDRNLDSFLNINDLESLNQFRAGNKAGLK